MFFHVLPFIFLRTIENEVRVKGTSSTSISAVMQKNHEGSHDG